MESAAFCWRPLLTFIAKNIEQRKYIRLILGAGEVLDAFCCHYIVLLEEGNLFLECLSRSEKNVILSSSVTKANGDIATLASNTSDAKKNEVEEKGKEEEVQEQREEKEVEATADQRVAYESIKQFYYMDVRLYEEKKFSHRERLWLEKYSRNEEKDGGAPADGDDEDFSVLRSYLETHCRDRNLYPSLMYPSIWKLFLHLVIAKKGGGENQGDEWKKNDHGHRGRHEGEDDEERKEDARIEMMKKRLRDKLKLVIDKEEEKERSL